jgi:hypothetical protein
MDKSDKQDGTSERAERDMCNENHEEGECTLEDISSLDMESGIYRYNEENNSHWPTIKSAGRKSTT